jgi:small subunit ribosomal protein S6
MKNYELTYLIKSDLTEEEVKEFQEKIISLIQEKGGVLGKINSPLKKKLAYPIKKEGQAYLATLNFQLNPEELAGLEKKIKLKNQILRYLILTKKEAKIIPEAIKIPPIAKKRKEVIPEKEKKVELEEIEKKLEEILKE